MIYGPLGTWDTAQTRRNAPRMDSNISENQAVESNLQCNHDWMNLHASVSVEQTKHPKTSVNVWVLHCVSSADFETWGVWLSLIRLPSLVSGSFTEVGIFLWNPNWHQPRKWAERQAAKFYGPRFPLIKSTSWLDMGRMTEKHLKLGGHSLSLSRPREKVKHISSWKLLQTTKIKQHEPEITWDYSPLQLWVPSCGLSGGHQRYHQWPWWRLPSTRL